MRLEGVGVVEVGARVPLPLPSDPAASAWVVAPDGVERPLDRGGADDEGRVFFGDTGLPGHYQLFWEGGTGSGDSHRLRAIFSVRVPRSESELGALSPVDLVSSVPGLVYHGGQSSAADGQDPGKVVRTASLVPVLLGLLGLFVLGEAWVIGRRA